LFRQLANQAERGFHYIERNQRPDGCWIPLWFGNQDHPDEENPIYGTAKVLMAYRDTGRLGSPAAQRGLEYLVRSQNADGGWGGGPSVRAKGLTIDGQAIESTIEETALALEALLDFRFQISDFRLEHLGEESAASANPQSAIRNPQSPCPNPKSEILNPKSTALPNLHASVERGVAWLCHAVENGRLFDPAPIGFYFAKLWYYERLYPLVFTVSALGRVLKTAGER
jgi:squalene-hopene/tetraprenyl-beta-curcumene cyclase